MGLRKLTKLDLYTLMIWYCERLVYCYYIPEKSLIFIICHQMDAAHHQQQEQRRATEETAVAQRPQEELRRQQDEEEVRAKADAEAALHEQLLQKQQELFRLQQERMELELQQYKAQVEQQKRDLKKRKEEIDRVILFAWSVWDTNAIQ